MTAKVHQLVICHMCHHQIKDEVFTEWEGSVYCEPCFELYKELVSPMDVKPKLDKNR